MKRFIGGAVKNVGRVIVGVCFVITLGKSNCLSAYETGIAAYEVIKIRKDEPALSPDLSLCTKDENVLKDILDALKVVYSEVLADLIAKCLDDEHRMLWFSTQLLDDLGFLDHTLCVKVAWRDAILKTAQDLLDVTYVEEHLGELVALRRCVKALKSVAPDTLRELICKYMSPAYYLMTAERAEKCQALKLLNQDGTVNTKRGNEVCNLLAGSKEEFYNIAAQACVEDFIVRFKGFEDFSINFRRVCDGTASPEMYAQLKRLYPLLIKGDQITDQERFFILNEYKNYQAYESSAEMFTVIRLKSKPIKK